MGDLPMSETDIKRYIIATLIKEIEQLDGMMSNVPTFVGNPAVNAVTNLLAEKRARLAELEGEI